MSLPTIPCDFCLSSDLHHVYTPDGSQREAQVYICNRCGLLQSFSSDAYKTLPRIPKLSCRADWGNVRHGKGLRMGKCLSFISGHLKDPTSIRQVLDIGSNRGHFMKIAGTLFPQLDQVRGVEPDQAIADWDKSDPKQTVMNERFEKTSFPDEQFDFVFSAHTLEHALSARNMLAETHRILKLGGFHFLEVPNLENIHDQLTVEEFFIDKHSFHFDREELIRLSETLGFEVIAGTQETDPYNIALLLRKTRHIPMGTRGELLHQPSEKISRKVKTVKKYAERLSLNRSRLPQIARQIESLAQSGSVAGFGAGRIFDALFQFGGLAPESLQYVVDTYIHRYMGRYHAVDIAAPSLLKVQKPDTLILFTRSSTPEIMALAQEAGIPTIVAFHSLFQASMEA
jgi:2-polyprenyl-3-methyl-5-hydroxy-6-metoxy-1,4-benzoquinol methylase